MAALRDCPGVVRLIDFSFENERFCSICYYRYPTNPISPERLYHDIVPVLACLEVINVEHGDINPNNIMVKDARFGWNEHDLDDLITLVEEESFYTYTPDVDLIDEFDGQSCVRLRTQPLRAKIGVLTSLNLIRNNQNPPWNYFMDVYDVLKENDGIIL